MIEIEILIKLLIATFCGAVIGVERRIADKPAGLRTTALITLGSCLFTIISTVGFEGMNIDISRVAAGIVTGIGFIGAGTIFRMQSHVEGLTTAATIWVSASIGMLIGLGIYSLAIFSTILTFFILLSKPIERSMVSVIKKYSKK